MADGIVLPANVVAADRNDIPRREARQVSLSLRNSHSNHRSLLFPRPIGELDDRQGDDDIPAPVARND